ncbi:MAG: response regulator transcription factor [Bacteroidales bacterium]|nr:response regulator transcription factor [Bacteroidales bacterium]
MSRNIKIVIADPSPMVQLGLAAMLHEIPDCEVVWKTNDVQALFACLHVLNPDVLILNPVMLDYSRRMLVRTLFEDMPDMKVVALVSSFVETAQLRQYHGVVEITDELQRVRYTLNQLQESLHETEDESESAQLSDREKDVLVCLAKGLKNSEIADQLHISIHTVITHRKNIVRKTGIKSVSALTVYAIINNLIDEKDII